MEKGELVFIIVLELTDGGKHEGLAYGRMTTMRRVRVPCGVRNS